MKSVFAHTLYTGSRVLSERYLIFEKDTVTAVDTRPAGQLAGEFAVLTPALIDAHSHIGMVRAGEPQSEAESNEHAESMLPHVDALDSLQMDDPALRDAVEMGVLYSCILPGSGNIIGGRTAVIRHYAGDSSAALISRAGIKAAMGFNPTATQSWQGARPTTRMGALAMLRSRFDEVARKMLAPQTADKGAKDGWSTADRVIEEILRRKSTLRVHVHKADDIAALLRFVDHYRIKVILEHLMDVHESKPFEMLKKRRIPIVYGPIDAFAYKVELKHERWRNIAPLLASGATFGLMSDHPVSPARQLLLQTRWFLRCGWSKADAIALVTHQNARILGIHDRLGTLEPGKWASFVGWSGDPFDLAHYPLAVYGEGAVHFSAAAAA